MLAAVIDHLWQSTLFVLLAWALASLLRRNGAHLRFRVWLAASLKFLVPFSAVATVAQWIGASLMSAPLALNSSVQTVAAPLFAPGTFNAAPDDSGWPLLLALLAWASGFIFLVARWFLRWRELQLILRAAKPSALAAPIPVFSSPTFLEPGIVGVRRPVLLLPERITELLDDRQLPAILEHEFCHVRRRDNLWTAIHMGVEAIFWFHPMVWWVGARLIHERERACDEAVVRQGHDAQTYAQGILEVCRHFVAARLACISGVSGADLQNRLEGIMKNDDIVSMSRAKRAAIGITALAVLAAPVVVGLTFPSRGEAQTAARQISVQLLDGKRVRLKYRDADLRSLLQAMAQSAHVNMLVSDQVKGTVTLDLAEMPWDQAFAIVLNSMGLKQHEKDGIIFVEPDKA